MSYTGQTVWITGASSGIGEALAYSFSAKGYNVILTGRNEENLKKTAAQIKSKSFILPFDLLDGNKIPEVCHQAWNAFKGIDIVVHNGGISQRSYAAETSVDVIRKIMEVNYFSYVAITKEILPKMVLNGKGSFIVMSSLSGKFGFYQRSAYASSKHALHGYFESLYLENRLKGIHVLMVCPGFIKTNISLNALNSEGNKSDKMDEAQKNGMDPLQCAAKILKAFEKKKVEIVIGRSETLPVLIKRYWPSLFWKIMFRLNPDKNEKSV